MFIMKSQCFTGIFLSVTKYVFSRFLLRNALQTALLVFFTTDCTPENCQDSSNQTEFPPRVFHQYLQDSYIDSFSEIMVIGDVHCCYTELHLLLQKANATDNNVLKILAGDMLTKGPNCTEVLHFVRNDPSVITVRGNTDQIFLEQNCNATFCNSTLACDNALQTGFLPEDFDFLKQLPYTMSIPSLNAIVVHGGIQPNVPLEDNTPFNLMNLRGLIPDCDCVGGFRPFSDDSEGVPWASQWTGPVHVYFGHDHPRNLQVYPFATGIDTSCVYGDNLTGVFIKGPRQGQFLQQKALKVYYAPPQ